MYQVDNIEIGKEVIYLEDGAKFRVRLKEKNLKGDYMVAVFTILEVYNGPTLYNAKLPGVGSDITTSEYKGAGAYAGWSIDQM